jgi:membrane protease YdiL (CAAX protease family)
MNSSAERSPLVPVAVAVALGVVGFVVGALVAQIGATLAAAAFGIERGTPSMTLVGLLGQGVGLVGVGYVYLRSRDRTLSYIRIRQPDLRDVAVGVVGTVALFAYLTAVVAVVNYLDVSLAEHSVVDLIERNPSVALLLVPASVLVTGPTEEFLYRGVVQSRLRERFAVPATVLVAAAPFALVHVPAYLVFSTLAETMTTVTVVLFPLGILLGLYYEYTENLVVPAVVHGVYNAVVFGINYADVVGVG